MIFLCVECGQPIDEGAKHERWCVYYVAEAPVPWYESWWAAVPVGVVVSTPNLWAIYTGLAAVMGWWPF